jgi:predicted Rdx family selenoprotein
MATEIWHDFGEDAPVTLIPVGSGRLEVYANEEKLFDRKAEGGAYPEMKRVREIKTAIRKRLDAAS